MIYTKDNIDGLECQYEGKGTPYTITVRTNDILVSWFNGSSSYKMETVLSFLNDKVWIPVKSKIHFNYLIL